MNYSMNSLHRNVNLILYPQPVSLDATANTYYRLLQQLENQNTGNNHDHPSNGWFALGL